MQSIRLHELYLAENLPRFLTCICKLDGCCVCSYYPSWVIDESCQLKQKRFIFNVPQKLSYYWLNLVQAFLLEVILSRGRSHSIYSCDRWAFKCAMAISLNLMEFIEWCNVMHILDHTWCFSFMLQDILYHTSKVCAEGEGKNQ